MEAYMSDKKLKNTKSAAIKVSHVIPPPLAKVYKNLSDVIRQFECTFMKRPA